MYTKKILSAAAAVAVMSVGAMAFDMNPNGSDKNATIITDITLSTDVNASYIGGVEANASLELSTNRQGDALIYPAFKSGDGWETEISVRNTKDVAIVAKAVLYAKDNSRELLDFNIYLSPHDVAKFTIKDGAVTSTDGSIALKVKDPSNGINGDDIVFASDAEPVSMPINEADVDAGYVVIYSMTQSDTANTYHLKHKKLFQDYRKMLDICRDTDNNTSTKAPWRDIFSTTGGTAKNGTATDANLTAPNVENNCTQNALFTGDWALDSNFTTPSEDALFGEVGIKHGGSDPRSLLLPAVALKNYTTDNQMMLWAEGEYASIQDRRIFDVNQSYSEYNTTGIEEDSKTFVVNHGYFSFEKGALEDDNAYAFILTQPTKRALIMAGKGTYWKAEDVQKNDWGYFELSRTPYDEDEGGDSTKTVGWVTITSPLNSDPASIDPYRDEVATLDYATMVKNLNADVFTNGETDGYIDLIINQNQNGLPAIVTQMVAHDVDGEAQINWINSATN
jgi:hypothetical protein